MSVEQEHHCQDIENYDLNLFFQEGVGIGKKVLILGESPAENGWRKSGKACYTPKGKLLPTGKRLNELLEPFNLSVETCAFTELAKCFVGKNRQLLLKCSQNCWPILTKQLESKNIELIISLGAQTIEIINFISFNKLKIGELSKIIINNHEYSILPIYHPSPINPYGRQKNLDIISRNKISLRQIVF